MTDSMSTRSRRPFAGLALLGASILALSSIDCSIAHRSQEFACMTTADCTGGRTCDDGFCVDGSGGPPSDARTIDASHIIDAPRQVDAATCPGICTSCDLSSGTCDIDCSQSSSCTGSTPVECPPGFACTIECSTFDACRSLSCVGAASCTIECSGQNSCHAVECGSGACQVTCDGPESCHGVACGESCACDVQCGATASCSSVICSMELCSDGQGGCSSSEFPECDTCPQM